MLWIYVSSFDVSKRCCFITILVKSRMEGSIKRFIDYYIFLQQLDKFSIWLVDTFGFVAPTKISRWLFSLVLSTFSMVFLVAMYRNRWRTISWPFVWSWNYIYMHTKCMSALFRTEMHWHNATYTNFAGPYTITILRSYYRLVLLFIVLWRVTQIPNPRPRFCTKPSR